MIVRFYRRLPGPAPVRAAAMALIAAAAVALLVVAYEYVGSVFIDPTLG